LNRPFKGKFHGFFLHPKKDASKQAWWMGASQWRDKERNTTGEPIMESLG
jgi:hypothetical protein